MPALHPKSGQSRFTLGNCEDGETTAVKGATFTIDGGQQFVAALVDDARMGTLDRGY